MNLLKDVSAMADWAADRRSVGGRIALVPTMGKLHRGHLSLVRLARSCADAVVVSIYVNPTQFAPGEDYESYPRDLDGDRALCQDAGVDAVFAPPDGEIYAADHSVFVEETRLSGTLCGRSRPAHFRGVATVLTKLFHIVSPHVAVFGLKDAQQARIVLQMVRDLHFGVRVILGSTVRETDGLAVSSRNARLGPADRSRAARLYESLRAARARFAAGEFRAGRLLAAARGVLAEEPAIRVEYLEAVAFSDLQPVERVDGPTLIALAAVLGGTRLIDNIILGGDPAEQRCGRGPLLSFELRSAPSECGCGPPVRER